MLPKNITSESLKNMLVFAKDCIQADLVGTAVGDQGFRAAIVQFQTLKAAEEARAILNGKLNATGDANMLVELVQRSPGGSFVPRNGQHSKFNGTFQNMEKMSPPARTSNFTNGDASRPDTYNSMFSPQSPPGQPADRPRISGKSVIGEDMDDETGKLLNDPVAYAKNDMAAAGMQQQARRSTLPHLPTTGIHSLNISAAVNSPSMSGLLSPRGGGFQSPPPFSPPGLQSSGSNRTNGFHMPPHHVNRQNPAANLADQNKPCNTLYVGNLPIDTSEDELKALFSKQRGYKRLCFRTKSNGPMCFVEFENITYATKTLDELYGYPLSNSVKGGIRLSFSKNPLGVRSPAPNGVSSPTFPQDPMSGMNGYNAMAPFTSANGPPPGLAAPPGLTSPIGHMQNGQGPFSPGGTFNGNMGPFSNGPMSPNVVSRPPLRSPTVAQGNGTWNGPNGIYPDYSYGREELIGQVNPLHSQYYS